MRIELKKFGRVLSSRSDGREAFLAICPALDPSADMVEVDFDGVGSLGPGWGDEFLGFLFKRFGKRLTLKNTENLSVQATLKLLEKIYGKQFQVKEEKI